MNEVDGVREPTKSDFVNTWGPRGYRENFAVYSAPTGGGATEDQVVASCLSPFYNRDNSCVEIGCGNGFWPERHLCNNFRHVTGLDVLSDTPFRAVNFTYIEVPDRDYSCYGIADESVDFVWSFGVFCHLNLPSIQKYLHSVYRILKPGGSASLYFSNNTRRPGHASAPGGTSGIIWVKNDLETSVKMLQSAGFKNPVDLMPDLKDTMLGVTKV